MRSSLVSPADETPIQQAPNAGVTTPDDGPAHAVVAPNPGARRPGESPIQQARAPNAGVGPVVEGPDQQSPNSSGRRPVQRDFMGGRRVSPNPGRRRRRPAQRRPRQGLSLGLGGLSRLELFGLLFLTVNSGMAMYQSWGDVMAISQFAVTYANIVSLLVCLKMFQGAPGNSTGRKKRNTLRALTWFLTTTLTFAYVYQVFGTTAKPTLQVAQLQWAMPTATGIAVFILFYQEDRSELLELLDV